jgi:hypothetical protein
MVESAMRHGTEMDLQINYVDSHGASFIGFGITRLLNFDLVARFKQINTMKLYLPGKGETFSYPRLDPVLTRPIRPEIIANNYDLMIKYATAIRQGTASTEALLRRFQRETTHPAYTAMLELGRAQRTIFWPTGCVTEISNGRPSPGSTWWKTTTASTTTSGSASAVSWLPTAAKSKNWACCACRSCKALWPTR